MTKLARYGILLSAFALLGLFTSPAYGQSDTTKSDTNSPVMPGHGGGSGHGGMAMMKAAPLPDSIRFQDGPFDSTLLTATFVIETRHRLFPKFYQLDTVKFGQLFPLGEDEQYSAKVTRFNPHLVITTKGEYKKPDDTLYNPAARLQVFSVDSLVQEGWAFHFVDAPHFRGSDYFGFKLVSFIVNEQKYIKRPEPAKE